MSRLITSRTRTPVIWTPGFLMLFAGVLALGLSLGSLLTQGWLNGYYAAEWVLLCYVVLNGAGWLAICLRTHTMWVRMGSIAGIIFSSITGYGFVLVLLAVDAHAATLHYLHAASASALLGTAIYLSSARTQLNRWDIWLLRIAPVTGVALVAIFFLRLPADMRSLTLLADYVTTTALWLCIAIWWLRALCWKTQTTLTLLSGLAALLLLLASQPDGVNPGNPFFFAQMAMLLLFLITLHILQCELLH